MYRKAGKWVPTGKAVPDNAEQAIPSPPIRAWQFHLDDAEAFVECTDGHLYQRTALQWTRRTNVAAGSHWAMARYGDTIYATSPETALLKWTPGTAAFVPVAGAPAGAAVVAVVRDFLVLANFGGEDRSKVHWSGVNQPENWTPNDNYSDYQIWSDIGEIHNIHAFEDGYLIGRDGVGRMALVGGEFVWQFDTLTRDLGMEAYGMSCAVDRIIYIASTEGFVALDLYAQPMWIGRGQVDERFRTLLDQEAAAHSTCFYDRPNRALRWSFASRQKQFPDQTLIYQLDSQSWGHDGARFPVRYVSTSRGMTWSQFAARYGNTFAVAGAAIDNYASPLIAGGVDTTFGFDDQRKAGPVSEQASGRLTTALIAGDGRGGRTLLQGVRPLSAGRPTVSVRPAEDLRGSDDPFVDCDPVAHDGVAYCSVSGRYFQFQLQTDETASDWLSGIELRGQQDGWL